MVEPREPKPTIRFIDEYCHWYQTLFSDVRSFEAFKHLHMGMLSAVKWNTRPAIAKVCGLEHEQTLHHFLTDAPWSVIELRQRRLALTLQVLAGRSINLILTVHQLVHYRLKASPKVARPLSTKTSTVKVEAYQKTR